MPKIHDVVGSLHEKLPLHTITQHFPNGIYKFKTQSGLVMPTAFSAVYMGFCIRCLTTYLLESYSKKDVYDSCIWSKNTAINKFS